MIIHSIIPLQQIFDGYKNDSNVSLEIVEFKGIKMEVFRTEKAEYQLNRIISTNPMDYLKPDLQPGTMINLNYFSKEI